MFRRFPLGSVVLVPSNCRNDPHSLSSVSQNDTAFFPTFATSFLSVPLHHSFTTSAFWVFRNVLGFRGYGQGVDWAASLLLMLRDSLFPHSFWQLEAPKIPELPLFCVLGWYYQIEFLYFPMGCPFTPFLCSMAFVN